MYYNGFMRKFIPEKAKLIPAEAKLVFRGEIYEVYQWSQKMYDGSTETFEMLRRPDTVKAVAVLTPEEQKKIRGVQDLSASESGDKIVITKQMQPRKDWFYDYPGGRMDETDADELEAAKREMREEAGMEFRKWKLVAVEQPFTKIDWLVYTFVATGLIGQVEQNLDAGEKIEVELATLEKIEQLAKADESQYLKIRNFEKIREGAKLEDMAELYKY